MVAPSPPLLGLLPAFPAPCRLLGLLEAGQDRELRCLPAGPGVPLGGAQGADAGSCGGAASVARIVSCPPDSLALAPGAWPAGPGKRLQAAVASAAPLTRPTAPLPPRWQAATKFTGSAIDVISHTGSVMRVTSLNAKGSWTRSCDTSREVMQKNAEGVVCKTTSWWEGAAGGFSNPSCSWIGTPHSQGRVADVKRRLMVEVTCMWGSRRAGQLAQHQLSSARSPP